MSEGDRFAACLQALHAATLDESAWPGASAVLEEACGAVSSAVILGVGDKASGVRPQFTGAYFSGERRVDLEQQYIDEYHAEDERVPRFRRLAFNRVVPLADLYTPQEVRCSPVFNEYLRSACCERGLNVRLPGPEGCAHTAWILGNPAGSDDWEPERLEMVERLVPHVAQYVMVRSALAGARVRGGTLAQLLEGWRLGVVLLDRNAKILEANARAREALRLGDRISDQNGFLEPGSSVDRVAFHERLAAALTQRDGAGTVQSIESGGGSPPPRVLIQVVPVSPSDEEWCGTSVAAFVLIAEPRRPARIRPKQLTAMMGLTPAESRVAAALGEGRTVRDIAQASGRQESSVYWHLRQIYARLGISRQADLVALVLTAAEFPASE